MGSAVLSSNLEIQMASFYATRKQQIAANVTEYQLLKFDSIDSRDLYCMHESGSPIAARAANKLMIADVWRTVRSERSNCVFHIARYIP